MTLSAAMPVGLYATLRERVRVAYAYGTLRVSGAFALAICSYTNSFQLVC